jgi:hypothetical protein
MQGPFLCSGSVANHKRSRGRQPSPDSSCCRRDETSDCSRVASSRCSSKHTQGRGGEPTLCLSSK